MKRVMALLTAFMITSGTTLTIVSCMPPDNRESRFGNGIDLKLLNSDSKLWNDKFSLKRDEVIDSTSFEWSFQKGIEKGISDLYKNYLNWDEVKLTFSSDLNQKYNTSLDKVNATFEANSDARTFKGQGTWTNVDIRPTLKNWVSGPKPGPIKDNFEYKGIFDFLFPNNDNVENNQAKKILTSDLKLSIIINKTDENKTAVVSATNDSKFFQYDFEPIVFPISS